MPLEFLLKMCLIYFAVHFIIGRSTFKLSFTHNKRNDNMAAKVLMPMIFLFMTIFRSKIYHGTFEMYYGTLKNTMVYFFIGN